MIINDKSVLADILQAVAGTWNVATDNDWKCIEIGKLRLFKKLCTKGSNVLPNKFLEEREDITPVLEFRKNDVTGQVLTLQQNAIVVNENAIVIIIQF